MGGLSFFCSVLFSDGPKISELLRSATRVFLNCARPKFVLEQSPHLSRLSLTKLLTLQDHRPVIGASIGERKNIFYGFVLWQMSLLSLFWDLCKIRSSETLNTTISKEENNIKAHLVFCLKLPENGCKVKF